MGKPDLVEPIIGADHLPGNPGGPLARTPDGGAAPDDLGERGIVPHLVQSFRDGFLQAPAHV